jgi:FkbM family methyltransferase
MTKDYNFTPAQDWIEYIDLEDVRKKNITIPYSIPILAQNYYELQKILKSDCFFEIGAFEADFSRKMKSIFPNSKVYAFEASPYCYDNYKNLNTSIEYLNVAISDKEGEIDFTLQDKNLSDQSEIEKIRGNNSILDRNDDTILYKKISVKSTTFDLFVEKESLENLSTSLWIDVEGANKNVLQGSKNFLKNVQSLLIEVEDFEYWKNQWLSADVDQFLKSFGFLPIVRDFEDNNQYNIVYINSMLLGDVNIGIQIKNWINGYFSQIGLETDTL